MEDTGLQLFILYLWLNNLWPAALLRNFVLASSVFLLSLPFDVPFAHLYITAGTAITLCNFSCAVFSTFNFSCAVFSTFNFSCAVFSTFNFSCAVFSTFNFSCAVFSTFNFSCAVFSMFNFSCAVFSTFNFRVLWKVLQCSQAPCS